MVKLGIIGMSEGNGHPYSWSAICNGYNPTYMKDCPFLAIPDYLRQKKFPQDTIKDAAVTHIWTQDSQLSQHIAIASNIKNIVMNPEDMIGEVDAILLARDDYEQHLTHSEPFIQAGMPIYIDKPIAVKVADALSILHKERGKGQIFSCTPLRYAKEFSVTREQLESLGEIKSIQATIMKSWDKYAIHVLEPILNIIGFQQKIKNVKKVASNGAVHVMYLTEEEMTINITVIEAATYLPFKITFFGTNDLLELEVVDIFNAFKASLETFIRVVQNVEQSIPSKEIIKTVEFIEAGLNIY
ncbi:MULTISPECIES: Gfo/Idh/MocA family oxidoreductase [Clostridia]|uniref:Gfo/Idh/MocA family oxidoreductase n=1 Tax=Clostridia TaxID=186801 RepID=UPI000EA0294B|nr:MULTISPECIES: Gfo/Idh/MocA family oxidoreductase [Clostridia]NBJ68071.1 hypothetical protein [Roseburia sp. 1XD42-34]RKI82512.1 hypothetical protein D7V87_01085 [Clostridium sp. 1xD42-85]